MPNDDPRDVRRKLGLQPGDMIVYELVDDQVRLRKHMPIDVAYLSAVQTTFSERNSTEDAAAFDDL